MSADGRDGDPAPQDEDEGGGDRDPITFDSSTPPLEWAMAALGLAVALVLLAGLIAIAVAGGDRPPTFEVSIMEPGPSADPGLVMAEVRNTGDQAAAAVQVQGELAGDPPSQAQAEIDYVPAGGTATVGLVFDRAPRPDELRITVVGWREP